MSVERFARLVEQIRDDTAAVSLYYLGDPLVHPDLDRLCAIAAEAGLQVHISTNLSFGLSGPRIRSLLESGLTHLTVCLDGLTQESYQRTRVGGNVDRVRRNLERLCRERTALGRRTPRIEVQYIRYQHNAGEEAEARRVCRELGVDEFTSFWGALDNWAGRDPDRYEVRAPRAPAWTPRCYWPWFSTVVKWNGEVIPCCTFRQGAQYAAGGDTRGFGNVFETDLSAIWNGPAYRAARRLAAEPPAADRDPALRGHFCHACPALFETSFIAQTLWGNHVRYEDVYELDARGRPRRRAQSAGDPTTR
jgi:MoaA/NifB/PqqE/SkfB family radical SAM enzyme